MRYSEQLRPLYHNVIARHLNTILPWTHWLTLSKESKQCNCGSGSEFEELTRRFFSRLNEKVYGNKRRARKVIHTTFIENRDKIGNIVDWHSHSLLFIEPEFVNKFAKEAEKQWLRLTPFGTLRVEKLYDLEGVSSYVAKHAMDPSALFHSYLGEK